MGTEATATDRPLDPHPNANGTVVNIGCAVTITTRSELSRRRSRGQGQTKGKGNATLVPFYCRDDPRMLLWAKLLHCVCTACTCKETHPRLPATCLLAQQIVKAHKITTNT